MNHGEAEQLREKLAARLSSGGFRSYPKVVHLKSENTYQVRVVIHPDEDSLVDKLGAIKTSPWKPPSDDAKQYVKKTPRTPSQNTDSFGFYPSKARRKHDGPGRSPDVNPAYPGLRRIPDLQDLVRRVAMRDDLKTRLAHVTRTVGRLQRLAAWTGSFRRESENLVSELLGQLVEDGHTGRHKIVRLARKLQKAMKADGYAFKEASRG